MCEGGSRERMIRSLEHFQYVQQFQQLLRGVTRMTINEGSVCFGFNLGFDNRSLVPPFIPVMRGEDTSFINLFRNVWRGTYFAPLPRLAYHAGQVKKRSITVEAHKAAQTAFNEALSVMLQSYYKSAVETETGRRLSAVGGLLSQIGQAPLPQFEKVMRTVWWQIAASQIRRLETAMKTSANQPEFWASQVREYANAYRSNLANRDFIASWDIVQAFGKGCALEKQQELTRKFGELLIAWPQLRDGAAELRRKEGVFGRAI
jgi:hypothetical protein